MATNAQFFEARHIPAFQVLSKIKSLISSHRKPAEQGVPCQIGDLGINRSQA